ncbi:MAG: hypothetical protein K5983_09065 [Lactobacillus sp.]|nr:hypothetical protein [Lactobacillus sp.]
MPKQFKDENGNTFVEVTPWYKKWWIWLLAVLVAIFVLGVAFGGNDSSESGSGKGHNTTASEKGQTTSDKVTFGYQDFKVKDSKTYNVDYTDNSWSGADVKIDKVTVYKLAKDYKIDTTDGDKSIQGFIKIHVSIDAKRDIDFNATTGTVSFGSQQSEYTYGSWDADTINSGASKNGDATFAIESLDSVSDVSSLRYKFGATFANDDTSDEDWSHDYDVTLDLQ